MYRTAASAAAAIASHLDARRRAFNDATGVDCGYSLTTISPVTLGAADLVEVAFDSVLGLTNASLSDGSPMVSVGGVFAFELIVYFLSVQALDHIEAFIRVRPPKGEGTQLPLLDEYLHVPPGSYSPARRVSGIIDIDPGQQVDLLLRSSRAATAAVGFGAKLVPSPVQL